MFALLSSGEWGLWLGECDTISTKSLECGVLLSSVAIHIQACPVRLAQIRDQILGD